MKKLLFGIFMISMLNVNAQDWSTVYRQVEEVTLKEGLENEYIEFEESRTIPYIIDNIKISRITFIICKI